MLLWNLLKAFMPKDALKKKSKAQIQKEKDDYERLLWERAEEYEEEE